MAAEINNRTQAANYHADQYRTYKECEILISQIVPLDFVVFLFNVKFVFHCLISFLV
jgi:hypothetical protein